MTVGDGAEAAEGGLEVDLQEFVSKTLLQIIAGVADAKNSTDRRGGEVSRRLAEEEIVKFDIAIVASDTTEKSGGLRVAGLVEAGGGKTSQEASTSRVQFSVPIRLP